MKNNIKGFSLPELLVAITILGIVAASVFTAFRPEKTEDKTVLTILSVVSSLLEDTKELYKVYPNSSNMTDTVPDECKTDNYPGLIECFVVSGLLVENSDLYNRIYQHPKAPLTNEKGVAYEMTYGYASEGFMVKVAGTAIDQKNNLLNGLDGKEAEEGNRVLSIVLPSNTASEELITDMK